MNKKLVYVIEVALVAALYCVLFMAVAPIATGPIQFRISEALMVLPALMPGAIPGVYLGCVLANILAGQGPIDVIFGGLATLLAAVLTRWLAKKAKLQPEFGPIKRTELVKRPGLYLLPLPSVIINALVVGTYLTFLLGFEGSVWIAVLVNIIQIAISEAIVVYLIGLPFFLGIRDIFVRTERKLKGGAVSQENT